MVIRVYVLAIAVAAISSCLKFFERHIRFEQVSEEEALMSCLSKNVGFVVKKRRKEQKEVSMRQEVEDFLADGNNFWYSADEELNKRYTKATMRCCALPKKQLLSNSCLPSTHGRFFSRVFPSERSIFCFK